MENRRAERRAAKITAENLSLWYGEKRALKEISMEIRKNAQKLVSEISQPQ